jgi:glycogen debranching enzyme
MLPDMFSGWGMRTLSSDHVAYNPFSYHRGSVWPVENGTAALGFARYGEWDALHRLAEGLFALSDLFVEGRLPESVGGLPRDADHPHPGIYPASCDPQAWSASMVVMLVQALIGMIGVAPLRLLVIDPHLPAWLPDVRLDGVRVGDAEVDLQVWRTASGQTRYDWKSRGRARVLRAPIASLF